MAQDRLSRALRWWKHHDGDGGQIPRPVFDALREAGMIEFDDEEEAFDLNSGGRRAMAYLDAPNDAPRRRRAPLRVRELLKRLGSAARPLAGCDCWACEKLRGRTASIERSMRPPPTVWDSP